MPINDQPTIQFVKNLRAAALRLLRLRRIATELKQQYWVHHQPILSAGENETIADGAPADGRPAMTGAQVIAVLSKLDEKLVTGLSDADANVLLAATLFDGVTGLD